MSRLGRYRRGLRRLGIRGTFFRILNAEEQTSPDYVQPSVTVPRVALREYPQGEPHMDACTLRKGDIDKCQ